jgi:transcriptional regulator with XRE-family HTH domain
MPEQLIANYINKKRIDAGLTYEAIAIESNIPESTVKNLCTGKTKNPGIETVMPIMEAVGGSYDEMLYPNKSKDEVKETSMLAMKDIYENQLNAIKESHEREVSNIRNHYEQHHKDLVDNFEKRLADKREIIELQKREHKASKIIAWVLGAILIALLIAEVMNPNLGWFRY